MPYVITYKDRSGVGRRVSVKAAETALSRLFQVENSQATSILIFHGVQQVTRAELLAASDQDAANDPKRALEFRVRAVLWTQWDPIGVNQISQAEGEYDSYAPAVAELLRQGASLETLVAHLLYIERELMELSGGYTTRDAAGVLLKLAP